MSIWRMRVPSFAVVFLSLAAQLRAQTLPPALTGEFFSRTPVQITSVRFNPTGTSSFTYSTAGLAFGPYPGTFTEMGTITIGPLSGPQGVDGFLFGPVTTVQAFFTIDSPVGQVTGTKELVNPPPDMLGLCYDFTNFQVPGGPIISGTFREGSPSSTGFGLSYRATIRTTTGTFGDEGISGILISQLNATVVGGTGTIENSDVFNEAFRSSLTTVFPASRLDT
jgi:hypothetical protein